MKRYTKAERTLRRIQKLLAPYQRKKKVKTYNTRGQWRDGTDWTTASV